jgi:membrane-bound inhibitor of C-type lysozyme
VAISATITACAQRSPPATSPGTEPAGRIFRWDCGAGTTFTVRYAPGDVAVVSRDGREVVLPRAVSGSGARYTDGTTTFWEHAGRARLETPSATYPDCAPVQG